MKIQYCLPIRKNTKQQVLQALNTQGYNYYEVWLDYIKNLDEEFTASLAGNFTGKIIFVSKKQNLKPLIILLLKFNVLLDLDFLTQQAELDFLRQKNSKIKLILSHHDYKKTPKLNDLENLIDRMKKYKPDIIKVSTFCQTEQDSLNLLNLLLKLKEQQLKYIVLGMGQKGLMTRIFGALWGNEITFAPKNIAEASAPGQLTKKQLETIFSILK